jgi:hypothetical protein
VKNKDWKPDNPAPIRNKYWKLDIVHIQMSVKTKETGRDYQVVELVHYYQYSTNNTYYTQSSGHTTYGGASRALR